MAYLVAAIIDWLVGGQFKGLDLWNQFRPNRSDFIRESLSNDVHQKYVKQNFFYRRQSRERKSIASMLSLKLNCIDQPPTHYHSLVGSPHS